MRGGEEERSKLEGSERDREGKDTGSERDREGKDTLIFTILS